MEQIINVGFLQNTYILDIDDKLVIIDPGYNYDKITKYLGDKKPDLILLTHYHFDHSACVDSLCEEYGIKAYVHIDDYDILLDNNLASKMGLKEVIVSKENIISFDAKIEELPSVEVIHAPGHSEGSVLFKLDEKLFTGDVLFINAQGRTDLIGSNREKQKASIKAIGNMDKSLTIFAGHGRSDSLENIIKNNNFFKVI